MTTQLELYLRDSGEAIEYHEDEAISCLSFRQWTEQFDSDRIYGLRCADQSQRLILTNEKEVISSTVRT